MHRDLVIDTNVLVHAENKAVALYADSRSFLEALGLDKCTTHWRVDPGFNLTEAQNRSLIVSEYYNNLNQASLGLAILASLAKTSRIHPVPRCSYPMRKRIQRRISKEKPVDRRLLEVAIGSDEKTLVTHDEEDFTDVVRNEFKNDGVAFIDATAACLVV